MELNQQASPAADVTCTIEGQVAVIRLDRPTAGNALNQAMRTELLDFVRRIRDLRSVRAVLLAAEGRHFCVGQDLKEHARALEHNPDHAFAIVTEQYNPLVAALHDLPQPVVAAVEGSCVGAGLGLALCADLRVAAENAHFATAFTAIGLAADTGVSYALAKALGPARATSLVLLGETFGAQEAYNWGLVEQVVSDGQATQAGLALARRLAQGPTVAFSEAKRLLHRAENASLAEVLDHEAQAQTRLGRTDDHRSAVRSFLARERPTFEGH